MQVCFTGHVQGVGFRSQVLDLAKGFDITGWIRNEPDGNVTLLAQGEANEVQTFVREVQSELRCFIKKTEATSHVTLPPCKGFRAI
jgi:acylphosphatase